MVKKVLPFIFALLLVGTAYGMQPGLVQVEESDGTPSDWVYKIKVTNGSLSTSANVATIDLTSAAVGVYTVATLPGTPSDGDVAVVTDGADATDCTTGSGTDVNMCVFDDGGAAWVIVGDGAGSGNAFGTHDCSTSANGTNPVASGADTLTWVDGEGIDITGNSTADSITVAGEDASTSNKGIASFSSDNFAAASGVITIKDGGVAPAELADGDYTDFSVSSGAATLDNDVVAAAEMADADHGMVSWSTGVATVEDFALNADADAGDVDIKSIDKLEGVDTAVYIDMGADTIVEIEADGSIKLQSPDIIQYEAVNDANPEFRQGGADAEEAIIQSVFDSGAQTLDYLLIETQTADATADEGRIVIKVDEAQVAQFDDAGLELGVSSTLDGKLTLHSDAGHATSLQPHGTTTGDAAYILPAADGTTGQYLYTDGSGQLAWGDPSGSGDMTAVGDSASGAAFTADGTGYQLWFEGTTANAYEILLKSDNPGADYTVTLPDQTGHVMLGASAGYTDNTLIKADGSTSHLTQATGITVDDSNNMSSIGTIGSGAITSTGDITSGDSFIIGSADIEESELEILDGASLSTTQINYLNAATGTTGTTNTNVVFSASPTLTGTAVATNIDGSGTFSANLFTPDAADGADIGSTTLEFSDVYLADGSVIKFGNDQEVTLTHVADTGLTLNYAIDLDDGTGASPSLIFTDATDETWTLSKADGGDLNIDINNASSRTIDINNAGAGNANLDVDGTGTFGGTVTSGGNAVLTAGASWSGDLSGTGSSPTVVDLTISGEAQGEVLYFDGSGWESLGVGTSGQYLQSRGSGANPQWASVTATPAGDDDPVGQIQYRDSGALAAEDAFYYTAGTNTLYAANVTSSGTITAASIASTSTSDPSWTFSDSDTSATGTGKIYTDAATAGQDSILHMYVDDSSGEDTEYFQLDGVSEVIDLLQSAVIADGKSLTFDESAADPNDADVVFSAADGKLTIAAATGANNEDLTFDFDAAANDVAVGTSTGVTQIDFGTIGLETDSLDLSEGNITNGGSIAIDAITADDTNVLFGSAAATQLQFRDTAIYINSANDGYLDLEADTGIRFNGPVSFANEGDIDLPNDSVDAADINTINCGTNCTWDTTNDEIDVDDAFLVNDANDTMSGILTTDGLTITTGNALTLGTTQWDDGSDKIDGEQIADDTIDNDSIDWADMTDLTTDGAVSWGNIAEGELTDDTVVEADLKAVDSASDEDFLTDSIAGAISAGALTNDSIVDADIDQDGTFTLTGAWTMGTVDATTNFTIDGLVLTADNITNDATLNIDVDGTADQDIVFKLDDNSTDWSITFDGSEGEVVIGDGDAIDHAIKIDASSNDLELVWDESVGVLESNSPIVAPIKSSAHDTNYTIGTNNTQEAYGHVFLNSAAGAITFTLPSAVAGMNVCIMQEQGDTGAITVQPAAGDYIVYQGARSDTAADYWVSGGAAEDKLCLVAHDATDWYATGDAGTWTEE